MIQYQHCVSIAANDRWEIRVWSEQPRKLYAIAHEKTRPTSARLASVVADLSKQLDECHAGIWHIGDVLRPYSRLVARMCIGVDGNTKTVLLNNGEQWRWDEVEMV